MISNAVLTQHAATIVGIITAAATMLVMYAYQRFKKPTIPTQWKAVAKVTKMYIYPFKSGRRIEVEKAECTKQGLMEMEKPNNSLRLRDRSFVVYHEENHEYRTGKQCPKLVLIEIYAKDANQVIINAPEMEALVFKIPNKKDNPEVVVKHFLQEEITSIDCGNEAATWISRYILGKDNGLRIAYHDGSYKRTQINTLYQELNNYYKRGLRNESTGLTSDLTAMNIINHASVRDLNTKMGNSDITVNNFRPSLVVDDVNIKPFEEDDWEWIKVGNVVMKNVLECMRCTLTTVDPETGMRRKDREPLKTMETYRISKGPEKSTVMGIFLEVFETGTISVGDVVYIGKTS